MRVPLHIEEAGNGPPLIALHGFGASTYTWRDVLSTFAETHHVYAVDLKGSGRSPKPRDGRYTMHDQAALVLELIAERRLPHVTLVGHSFGGGVALLTALTLAAEPGMLESLILFDCPAYRQRFPAFIRWLRMPVLGPLLQRLTPVSFQVRTVLRLAYHRRDLITDDVVAAYAAPLRTPGAQGALRETARQIVPTDIDAIAERYPSLQIPTLLIWGRHDAIVPLAIGQRLHQAIGGSRLIVLDDSGHVPHEEMPAQVRPILREFLASAHRT
ncbi:MAG: alpha/beta fold hydrolase [Vicinamibacterales bacterium]